MPNNQEQLDEETEMEFDRKFLLCKVSPGQTELLIQRQTKASEIKKFLAQKIVEKEKAAVLAYDKEVFAHEMPDNIRTEVIKSVYYGFVERRKQALERFGITEER